MSMVDNSFFAQSYRGRKVLVLAPHQDDEVHIAGSLIYSLSQAGAEVYCAYSTNGDFQFKADTRIREALAALAILGVPAKRAFFLGYGDTLNHTGRPHIFYAENESAVSPAGFKETYGTKEHPDFAWQRSGEHSPYLRQHYKADLQGLLLSVQAEVVFCVDYDQHADHRMLSLLFTEVMGDILQRKENDYEPLVYKSLAYATAYEAVTDFYAANIRSVQRPLVGEILDFPVDMLQYSFYGWEDRVRFPVAEACRGRFLRNNILFRALCRHRSQGPAMHAENTINGDIVFWQRRTDNLAFRAQVSVSSGDAAALQDFRLFSAQDIDTEIPMLADCLWQPLPADYDREIVFSWTQPQDIRYVVLYGNIHAAGRILQAEISLDNGSSISTAALPPQGRPLVVQLPWRGQAEKCKVRIKRAEGELYGLAGCEIFSAAKQQGVIKPFLKIMSQGQFIYDYWVSGSDAQIPLDIYQYGFQTPSSCEIISGSHSRMEKDVLCFGKEDKQVIVRAYSRENSSIYDQVVISRHSQLEFFWLSCRQWLEKKAISFCLRRDKKYMYLRNKYIRDI